MQFLNPTMTLQTCLQARSPKQRFVSCSRVKRNACKKVTKSTQIRNGMCDTNFFSAASGQRNELFGKRIRCIGTVFLYAVLFIFRLQVVVPEGRGRGLGSSLVMRLTAGLSPGG